MQATSLVLLSQQQALQRALDIVANNVANVSTTGFKREGIAFDTLLERPAPNQSINFVIDRATYRDVSGGPIQPTGNQLDLAIQGAGYFQVQGPGGNTRYTRGGSFQVNTQGLLVTQSGLPVLGDGGQPITIPDTVTDLNISADGFITAKTDNGTSLAELGKVAIVQFDDENQLQPLGNGIYATTQQGKPAPDSAIVQSALEQSNVVAVTELTNMIKIQRSYEQATNMISSENNRLNDAITKLSKTTV